jgi:hypothetical protein
MRGYWLGALLSASILISPQLCPAGEFAGRLERVDLESVTVRDSSDKSLVIHVDRSHRIQAAPFLGKWVTVRFQDENGVCRALGFRSPQ